MKGICNFGLRILIVTINCTLFASWAIAQNIKAYVGNFIDNSVSVIDTNTHQVIKTIPMILGPAGMSSTPDGRFVYVAESTTDTLARIDTNIDRVVSHIEVGKTPQGVTMAQAGKLIIVGMLGTDSIVYVDTKLNDVVVKFLVGKVKAVVWNPKNTLIYAGLNDPGQFAIAVVDLVKQNIVQTISLQNAPRELAVSPDGAFLYLTSDIGPIQIIDTKKNMLINTIPIPSPTQAITFTHDGKWGLVTSLNEGTISFFDPKTNTVKYTIPVGKQPYGIAISEDDKTAYVTNETSNNVVVVDIDTKKVTATIPVGNGPHSLVFAGYK